MKKKSAENKMIKLDGVNELLEAAEAPASDTPPSTASDTGKPKFFLEEVQKAPITIERRVRSFEAIRFDGLENLLPVLRFLGDDFYALTQGDPIVVGSRSIELDKVEGGMDANLLLVIRDNVANVIHAIRPGKWIIRDPDIGYRVIGDRTLIEQYDVTDW